MGRFLAGAGSVLLLLVAGFFLWRSGAESRQSPIKPAPAATVASAGAAPPGAEEAPPAATEKTREEKRFARADRDDDGRITRAELLEPRRKAFAKLDANGDGRLSFEEWAVKTVDKFTKADADKNGALTPAEYATTKPKRAAPKRCACTPSPAAPADED